MADQSSVSDLRAAIDESIAAGDRAEAVYLLGRLWHEHGGPTQAGFVTGRWASLDAGPSRRATTMAVLRSFTVEPLVPIVRAGAAVADIDLTVHVGDFNTYAQEILDPASQLYTAWSPDIVVLAVHTRDIAPELWSGFGELDGDGVDAVVDRVTAELGSLVQTFRQRSAAHLVVHGLEQPADLAFGVADRRAGRGQAAAIADINRRLAEQLDGVRDGYFLDYDAVVARAGREAMLDERKWAIMRMPISSPFLIHVADEWLRFVHPLVGRVAKVLAVDLDNTLWGGTIGEDGLDGIALDAEGKGAPYIALQRALLDLRARGVLLAVCSKNNHDDAVEVLDGHPEMLLRSKDFHAIKANWDDKASNLLAIAADLNVGIDSIAFLDDNPAERSFVARQLPMVSVLPVADDPAAYAPAVRRSPLFERLSLSTEDRQRSEYYERERERGEAMAGAATLEGFLESLRTRVDIFPAASDDVARVAQLTQKTNQFNVTTRRYTEAQIAAMVDDEAWRVYALRAADRFGDHGLVGVGLVESTGDQWRIDTFLLSCRVIGRQVETALIHVISADAAEGGAGLVGEFSPTAKNAPAADFYDRHGFTPIDDEGDVRRWVWAAGRGPIDPPTWIEIGVNP